MGVTLKPPPPTKRPVERLEMAHTNCAHRPYPTTPLKPIENHGKLHFRKDRGRGASTLAAVDRPLAASTLIGKSAASHGCGELDGSFTCDVMAVPHLIPQKIPVMKK